MSETKATMVSKLKMVQNALATQRDELRDLVEEAESVLNDCVEAHDNLGCAIDALSRMQ